MKNIFQELFQTWNPFHNVMALWSHHLIIFPFTQQNENEIAYEHKTNENLVEQQISFPMYKPQEKLQHNKLFKLFYLFANRNK
jgi:hypothetical protein